MLALAGARTAGTSIGSCGPRTIASYVVPRLREAATAAGRPAPRIIALVHVCVTDDVEAVRANAREQNVLYDQFPSYRRALDREGVASGADLLVAGTPDDVLAGLRAYADAGVTDLRLGVGFRTEDERVATKAALVDLLAP
jgi:alkanesulfonate monooxygenase SsuD/methylene tetrahydromethanopterin reductase-like flavin-dependent oxidoreductase (luciferase family)